MNNDKLELSNPSLRKIMAATAHNMARTNLFDSMSAVTDSLKEDHGMGMGEVATALIMHAAIIAAASAKQDRIDLVKAINLQVVEEIFEVAAQKLAGHSQENADTTVH